MLRKTTCMPASEIPHLSIISLCFLYHWFVSLVAIAFPSGIGFVLEHHYTASLWTLGGDGAELTWVERSLVFAQLQERSQILRGLRRSGDGQCCRRMSRHQCTCVAALALIDHFLHVPPVLTSWSVRLWEDTLITLSHIAWLGFDIGLKVLTYGF